VCVDGGCAEPPSGGCLNLTTSGDSPIGSTWQAFNCTTQPIEGAQIYYASSNEDGFQQFRMTLPPIVAGMSYAIGDVADGTMGVASVTLDDGRIFGSVSGTVRVDSTSPHRVTIVGIQLELDGVGFSIAGSGTFTPQ
jgi:hypothetical protein